jgi:hypothetical protein
MLILVLKYLSDSTFNSCAIKYINFITAWFLGDTCCSDKNAVMFVGSTRPCHGSDLLSSDLSNQFQICRNMVRAADVASHTATHIYPLLCAI